jgi:hypothetical protein
VGDPFSLLLKAAIFVAILTSNCWATLYVHYDGDTLPEDHSSPFEFEQGRTVGPRSVDAGILTLENPDSSGSQGYKRADPMLADDLVVQQFRVRVIDPEPSNSVYKGAVTHFEFGDTSNATIGVLVFVLKDEVRLRQIERSLYDTNIFEDEYPLDTESFHTYTMVRRQQDLRLFIDGVLALRQEHGDLGPPRQYAPQQMFQANPSTVSEWDFFRYAIGPDALKLIPVPEPSSFLILSMLVFVTAGVAWDRF